MIEIIALVCLLGTPEPECSPSTAHSMASVIAGSSGDMATCRLEAELIKADRGFIRHAQRVGAYGYIMVTCVDNSHSWFQAGR